MFPERRPLSQQQQQLLLLLLLLLLLPQLLGVGSLCFWAGGGFKAS